MLHTFSMRSVPKGYEHTLLLGERLLSRASPDGCSGEAVGTACQPLAALLGHGGNWRQRHQYCSSTSRGRLASQSGSRKSRAIFWRRGRSLGSQLAALLAAERESRRPDGVDHSRGGHKDRRGRPDDPPRRACGVRGQLLLCRRAAARARLVALLGSTGLGAAAPGGGQAPIRPARHRPASRRLRRLVPALLRPQERARLPEKGAGQAGPAPLAGAGPGTLRVLPAHRLPVPRQEPARQAPLLLAPQLGAPRMARRPRARRAAHIALAPRPAH